MQTRSWAFHWAHPTPPFSCWSPVRPWRGCWPPPHGEVTGAGLWLPKAGIGTHVPASGLGHTGSGEASKWIHGVEMEKQLTPGPWSVSPTDCCFPG